MKSIIEYINESGNIEKWYGVSINHDNFIEVLGHAICPKYKDETEDEMKLRFAKERHDEYVDYFKSELKKAEKENDESKITELKKYLDKPFDAKKSVKNYIFW